MQVRRCMVVTLALVYALGAVPMAAPAALAGGDQTSSTQRTNPRVKPTVGHRHTAFELTFTLADAPGKAGLVDTSYREVVSRPAQAAESCSPTQPAPVVSGPQGTTANVPLEPSSHGWCKGRYVVTVFLQRTSTCGPPVAGPASIACPVVPKVEPGMPVADLDTGEAHFTVR